MKIYLLLLVVIAIFVGALYMSRGGRNPNDHVVIGDRAIRNIQIYIESGKAPPNKPDDARWPDDIARVVNGRTTETAAPTHPPAP